MTSALRGREGGWSKRDDSTDRLREWDSDKGGRGSKNPKILRTSFKYRPIANIYGVVTIGQAMIFCHTRKTAAWLVEKMTKDGHAVALLSGELTVEERIQVSSI